MICGIKATLLVTFAIIPKVFVISRAIKSPMFFRGAYYGGNYGADQD